MCFLLKGAADCWLKNKEGIEKSQANSFWEEFDPVCGIDCLSAECDIVWRTSETDVGIELADMCDFGGNDLYSKAATSGEECAQYCKNEDRCNHFTYSTVYGKAYYKIYNCEIIFQSSVKFFHIGAIW